jgi:3D (Asp-Asp-Asp) domain-containing protein
LTGSGRAHLQQKRPSLLADYARKTARGRYKVNRSSSRTKRNVDETYTALSLVVVLFCELLCSEYKPRGSNYHKVDRRAARATRAANNGLYSYTRSRHNAAKNANGSHLKSGDLNSAAADWSRFLLGIKFKICGTHQTYVVDDYGPALVGTNKIDLYMPSLREMHHWGVRKVTINIIEQARMTGVLHSSNHESTCRTYEGWSKS